MQESERFSVLLLHVKEKRLLADADLIPKSDRLHYLKQVTVDVLSSILMSADSEPHLRPGVIRRTSRLTWNRIFKTALQVHAQVTHTVDPSLGWETV